MRATFRLFIDFIRKPEWVAAVALLIQAVILWLQARILRKHGKTMEEHAGIARDQASTAELIGKALEQHAKILSEQSKLTEAQFKFQRMIEVHAAREKVYDQLFALHSSVLLLISKITSPGQRYPDRLAEELMAQGQLLAAIAPTYKASLISLHLTDEEKYYFKRYTDDLGKIVTNDLQGQTQPLKDFIAKYKDVFEVLLKAHQSFEV
jgi:hypothetical protein